MVCCLICKLILYLFVLVFIRSPTARLSIVIFLCCMLFFMSGGSRKTTYFRLCCSPHFHHNNYHIYRPVYVYYVYYLWIRETNVCVYVYVYMCMDILWICAQLNIQWSSPSSLNSWVTRMDINWVIVAILHLRI